MVKPGSLISPALVLSSQDSLKSSSSGQTPVFGDPFRFGRPLVFKRSAATDTSHGARESSTPLQIQSRIIIASSPSGIAQLQQNSSRRQTGVKRKTPIRDNQLTPADSATALDGKQQCNESRFFGVAPSVSFFARSNAIGDSSADAALASAAPDYYLSSLGAALAHGLASPAAATAALAATASTAANLALSSQQPCQGLGDLATARKSGSCADTSSRPQLPCSGQASQLGPAATAAAVAASAACSGCPGCRMILQRLQSCSHCTKPKLLSGTAIGGTANSCSADGPDARNKALDSHDVCRQKACHMDDTPGPGQYDVPSSFGQGPGYSIGSKAAPTVATKSGDDIPGPGSYHNPAGSSAVGGPAFSIGGRWKDPGQDAAAPGPGEHQKLAYIVDGPAFTISSKRSSARRVPRSSSPGPGAYAPDWDISRSAEGPAYSMGGRASEPRNRPASPGPAEYHRTTAFRPEGPAYSFPAKPKGRSTSASAAADGPAPTDYNAASSIAATSKIKSAPAYSFSAKQTPADEQLSRDVIPGPGSYHVSDVGPVGPAFSMRGRGDTTKQKAACAAAEPGPGEYYMETVLGSSGPAFSLAGKANSPRAAAESDALRGPGVYYNPQAEAALQGGKAFTIGSRLVVGEAGQDSPGPASYSLPVEQLGPAITIAGRPKLPEKAFNSPGPASYDLRPTLPEGPCFTMGSKAHEGPTADDGGPAVGEYEVVDFAGMEVKGPAWTLGIRRAATEDKQAAETPGPGQYHAGAPSSAGPAWSMAGKWVESAPDPEGTAAVTPGPGEHHQQGWSSLGGPAFTLAGKAAATVLQENTPGPGAYLTTDYKDPAENGTPAYTMGSRPAPQEPADNLGPGAFDLPELTQGPAFTLGMRHTAPTTADDSATPGPAAYDTTGAASALGAAAPAWTMGQRPKEELAGGATPAPGDYDVADPSAAAAPAWTMGTNTAGAGADAAAALDQQLQPGPGHYTPTDPVRDGRGVAASIGGKWKEATATGSDGPAPGEYEVPAVDSGPAFTLAGRALEQGHNAAATPAPGQYHKPSQAGAHTPAYTIAGKLAASSAAAAAAAADVGPGSYDVAAAYAAAVAAVPAFTLTGKGRPESYAAAGADSPGVGAYMAEAGAAGPAYSIGLKLAVNAKVADGPSCVDYNTEGVLTSTTSSAPAYTMGAKPLPPTTSEDATPAPGTYHGPATAGAPPSAPAAPAYSMQGKARKGKSRLRQMLGKLAELDTSEPGPGENQPTAGGSTLVSGPQFSFGSAVVPPAASRTEGGALSQTHSLAQLQAQLAALLTKETRRAAYKANKAAATAGTHAEDSDRGSGCAGPNHEQQQQQHRTKLSNSGRGVSGSSDLASISAAVHHALLLCKNRRSKPATGASSSNRHQSTDYTSPAPGDHHMPIAENSFGASGPAYTLGTRGKDSSSNRTSVADADGFTAVMAAAAAADRVAAVPGPGTYHVEKPFPNPEGQVVYKYKPILKKNSSSGSGNKRVSFSGGSA